MSEQNEMQLFEDQPIRTAWDAEREEWYFSVVDVCKALSGTDNPRRYWSDLKRKLKSEGSELYEKIVQLKMRAEDGKNRLTDVADTEQCLRLIQSIPLCPLQNINQKQFLLRFPSQYKVHHSP